jgi:hypothetical protein
MIVVKIVTEEDREYKVLESINPLAPEFFFKY